ncbi:cysteinyl-tRNA synthetase [Dimargaris cristalligena]|nr:cysteinyl-tRNA synthetase [Dimargaris cristalligena]
MPSPEKSPTSYYQEAPLPAVPSPAGLPYPGLVPLGGPPLAPPRPNPENEPHQRFSNRFGSNPTNSLRPSPLAQRPSFQPTPVQPPPPSSSGDPTATPRNLSAPNIQPSIHPSSYPTPPGGSRSRLPATISQQMASPVPPPRPNGLDSGGYPGSPTPLRTSKQSDSRHPTHRIHPPSRAQHGLLNEATYPPAAANVSPRNSNDTARTLISGPAQLDSPHPPGRPNQLQGANPLANYSLNSSVSSSTTHVHHSGSGGQQPPVAYRTSSLTPVPNSPNVYPPSHHSPTKEKKKGFPFFKRRKNRDKEKAEQEAERQKIAKHREKRSGSDGGSNSSWGLGHLVSSLSRPPPGKQPSAADNYDLQLDTNVSDMEGIVNMDKAHSLKDYPDTFNYSRRGSNQRSLYDDYSDRDTLHESERHNAIGMNSRTASNSNTSLPYREGLGSEPGGPNGALPPMSTLPSVVGGPRDFFGGSDGDGGAESPELWAPPDSWAILPGGPEGPDNEAGLDDGSEEEGEPEVDDTAYYLRIYRRDLTFCTVACRLNSTSAEIIQLAAKKFYIENSSKYCLYVKKANSLERTLRASEKPVLMLRDYLEQMGYTREDNLSAHMREDNTYLCQFTLIEAAIPSVSANLDHLIHAGRQIDLKGHRLQTIPVSLYHDPSKILYLNLSKNLKIDLPTDFTQLCTELRELRLATCQYRRVPQSIRYISSLILLDLSGNEFHHLNDAHLEELRNLQDLLIRNNRLQSIPPTFARFKTLRRLILSNNNLTNFPEVLCEITTLTQLDLSFNFIPAIPESIGQLKDLRNLSFLCNRLTGALPVTFKNLRRLEKLDVRRNHIQDIMILSRLPRLQILYCDHNSLSKLSGDFQALKDLSLAKSHLTNFFLRDASHTLVHLKLSHCQINELSADLFTFLPSLQHVEINNNHLTSLPKSIGQLSRLRHLACTNNNLTSLPVEVAGLPRLEILDVHSNNIKSLFVDIWMAPKLRTLNISSNLLEFFPHPSQLERSRSAAAAFPSPLLTGGVGPGAGAVSSPLAMDDNQRRRSVLPGGKGHHVRDYGGYRKSSLDETASGRVSRISAITGANGINRTLSRSQSQFDADLEGNGDDNGNNANGINRTSLAGNVPPLCQTLMDLRMGGNYFNEEIFTPLTYLEELRILNLSFNEQIYEIPAGAFYHHTNLVELYLSGTQIATLPGEDLDRLRALRVLHVNANKLQTLPAELGKIGKLTVLDAGSNTLRYNISNWPYDWNWNWNLDLQYLNLSNNKRLEIKRSHMDVVAPHGKHDRDLAHFRALTSLRVLGLMDVTMVVSPPDQTATRRVRTTPSVVDSIQYGMADKLGPDENLCLWDFVVPSFRGRMDESLFGLFDSPSPSTNSASATPGRNLPNNHGGNGITDADKLSGEEGGGSRLFACLNDQVAPILKAELDKLRSDEAPPAALRRAFLALNKHLGSHTERSSGDDSKLGASALFAYFVGNNVYLANVGNIMAVASRKGRAELLSDKHTPANPDEVTRIREAGGYISQEGLVQGEVEVTRSFGYFHLLPYVNANPSVYHLEVTEEDEFLIIASRGLWDYLSHQMAVDVARTLRHDMNLAAQKLRDYAISYGADKSLMVMVLGMRDLCRQATSLRNRNARSRVLPANWGKFSLGDLKDDPNGIGALLAHVPSHMPSMPPTVISRARRGAKDDLPADSTLARLDREVEPPTGDVALVFTDIKNSTFLWETIPVAMRSAIRVHNHIMRRELRTIGGYEVKTEGDAFMVSFATVPSALHWCLSVQLQLLKADWPQEILDSADGREIYSPTDANQLIYRGLWVRMGVHWGSPVCEEDPVTKRMDYFGPMVNRTARICGAADGGQIYVSQDVVSEIIFNMNMFDTSGSTFMSQNGLVNSSNGSISSAPGVGAANTVATPGAGGDSIASISGIHHPISGSHSSSIASNTSIAALSATAHLNNTFAKVTREQVIRDIQGLNKLGLNMILKGERRLKGLETPETLVLAYPKDLAGRLEFEKQKAELANPPAAGTAVGAAQVEGGTVTGAVEIGAATPGSTGAPSMATNTTGANTPVTGTSTASGMPNLLPMGDASTATFPTTTTAAPSQPSGSGDSSTGVGGRISTVTPISFKSVDNLTPPSLSLNNSPRLRSQRDKSDLSTLVEGSELPTISPSSGPRIIVRPPVDTLPGLSPEFSALRTSIVGIPSQPLHRRNRSLSNYQVSSGVGSVYGSPPFALNASQSGSTSGGGLSQSTGNRASLMIHNGSSISMLGGSNGGFDRLSGSFGAPIVESPSPTSHLISRESLWHLEQICFRVERLSQFFINDHLSANAQSKSDTSSHRPFEPYRFSGPAQSLHEPDLLRAADNLITRIDHATRSLYSQQSAGALKVLEDAPAVFTQHPEYLQAALDLFMNMVQADPGKFMTGVGQLDKVEVVEGSNDHDEDQGQDQEQGQDDGGHGEGAEWSSETEA